MKTVLILEDDLQRVKKFRQYHPSMIHVDNVKDCIKQLKELEKIDELWLDHDLGGQMYVKSESKNCGFEIVRYLQKHDMREKIHSIFVHSHNGYAVPHMVSDLSKAGYIVRRYPFYQFKQDQEISNLKEKE